VFYQPDRVAAVLGNFSLNLVSFIIAMGMLVDNAIVVVNGVPMELKAANHA